MAKQHNVAARLLVIFKRAASTKANDGLHGWASVLGVEAESESAREREVARLLSRVQEAIDEVRADLQALAWDPDTYEPTLGRIGTATSLKNLISNWTQVQQHLTPEILGPFAIFAEALPEGEVELTEADLKDLKKVVGDLAQHVAVADLPPNAIRFLLDQLRLIEIAIAEYPIRGSAAFRDASVGAAANWADPPTEVRDNITREEVQKVAGLWSRFEKYGRRYMFIHRLAWALLSDVAVAAVAAKEVHLLLPAVCAPVSQPAPEIRATKADNPNGTAASALSGEIINTESSPAFRRAENALGALRDA